MGLRSDAQFKLLRAAAVATGARERNHENICCCRKHASIFVLISLKRLALGPQLKHQRVVTPATQVP